MAAFSFTNLEISLPNSLFQILFESGLGFWEHQIPAGATYSFGRPKLWNTFFLTTWEISHSKNGLDVKPGPMLTGEYSFGCRFDKYRIAGRNGRCRSRAALAVGRTLTCFADCP